MNRERDGFFRKPVRWTCSHPFKQKKIRKTPTHQGSRDITCSWKRYDLSIFLTTRQHPTIKMAGKNIPTNLRTGHHSIVVSLLCPVSAWVVPLILTSLTWNILGVLYLNKRIIYYKVVPGSCVCWFNVHQPNCGHIGYQPDRQPTEHYCSRWNPQGSSSTKKLLKFSHIIFCPTN